MSLSCQCPFFCDLLMLLISIVWCNSLIHSLSVNKEKSQLLSALKYLAIKRTVSIKWSEIIFFIFPWIYLDTNSYTYSTIFSLDSTPSNRPNLYQTITKKTRKWKWEYINHQFKTGTGRLLRPLLLFMEKRYY